MSETRVSPFHCGSQMGDWETKNCNNCHLQGYYRDQENQNNWVWRCDIQKAVGEAYIGDGMVSGDIAERMGATRNELAYGWRCNELVTIEPIAVYAKRFERPQTQLLPLWKRLRMAWESAREYREASYADEYDIGWRLSWQIAWGVYHDYTEVVKCGKCGQRMPVVPK